MTITLPSCQKHHWSASVLAVTEEESWAQLLCNTVTAVGLAVKSELVCLTAKSVNWNRKSPNTFPFVQSHPESHKSFWITLHYLGKGTDVSLSLSTFVTYLLRLKLSVPSIGITKYIYHSLWKLSQTWKEIVQRLALVHQWQNEREHPQICPREIHTRHWEVFFFHRRGSQAQSCPRRWFSCHPWMCLKVIQT